MYLNLIFFSLFNNYISPCVHMRVCVILIKYKIKDEMGRKYSVQGRDEEYKILVGKPEEKT